MVAKGVTRAGRIEITEGNLPPEGTTVEVNLKQVAPPPADPVTKVFGLWKNRADIEGSCEHVTAIRDGQWKRP